MIAAIILAASQTIAMIVIGRVFQGVAVSTLPQMCTYCLTFAVMSLQAGMSKRC